MASTRAREAPASDSLTWAETRRDLAKHSALVTSTSVSRPGSGSGRAHRIPAALALTSSQLSATLETSTFVVPAPTSGPPSRGWNSPSPSSSPPLPPSTRKTRAIATSRSSASCLRATGAPGYRHRERCPLSQIRKDMHSLSSASSSSAASLASLPLPCSALHRSSALRRLLALLVAIRILSKNLLSSVTNLDRNPIDAQVSSTGMALLSRSSSPLPGREVFFHEAHSSSRVSTRVESSEDTIALLGTSLSSQTHSPSGHFSSSSTLEIRSSPLAHLRTETAAATSLWPSPSSFFLLSRELSRTARHRGSASTKIGSRYREAFCLAPWPWWTRAAVSGPCHVSIHALRSLRRPSDSRVREKCLRKPAAAVQVASLACPAVPMDSRMQFGQSSSVRSGPSLLLRCVKGV